MTAQNRQQLEEWFNLHGTLSAVFLQVKLKISFKEAIRLIEEFQNGAV
jgi:hypothetical protein